MNTEEIQKKLAIIETVINDPYEVSLDQFIMTCDEINDSFLSQLPNKIEILVQFSLALNVLIKVNDLKSNEITSANSISHNYLVRASQLLTEQTETPNYHLLKEAVSIGRTINSYLEKSDEKVFNLSQFPVSNPVKYIYINKAKTKNFKVEKDKINSFDKASKFKFSLINKMCDKARDGIFQAFNSAGRNLINETENKGFPYLFEAMKKQKLTPTEELIKIQLFIIENDMTVNLLPYFERHYECLLENDGQARLPLRLLNEIKTILESLIYVSVHVAKMAHLLSLDEQTAFQPYTYIKFEPIIQKIKAQIKINEFKHSSYYSELTAKHEYKKRHFFKDNKTEIKPNKQEKNSKPTRKCDAKIKKTVEKELSLSEKAYADFLKGNFSQAIFFYNEQLKITPENLMKTWIYLCIGDCYLYWCKSTPDNLSLKEKLQETVTQAAQLINEGIKGGKKKQDYEKWKLLFELNKNLLTVLSKPDQDIQELIDLLNDDSPIEPLSNYDTPNNDNKDEKFILPAHSFKLAFPQSIHLIINQHISENHSLYISGGAVRDWLLQKNPTDWDLVTSAFPDQSKNLIGGNLYGKRSPILSLKDAVTGYQIELSTFRGRSISNPVTLDNDFLRVFNFGQSLQEDSQGRDFTINTGYYNPIEDNFFSFNTYWPNDIKERIIRTTNPEPHKSFAEDPIRILRALRFAITLKGKIEKQTNKALFESLHLLKQTNPGRILHELQKIFRATDNTKILEKLNEHRILDLLFKRTSSKNLSYIQLQESLLKCFNLVNYSSSLVVILLYALYPEFPAQKSQDGLALIVIDSIVSNNEQYFFKNLKLAEKFKRILLHVHFPELACEETLEDDEHIIINTLLETLSQINFCEENTSENHSRKQKAKKTNHRLDVKRAEYNPSNFFPKRIDEKNVNKSALIKEDRKSLYG